MKTKNGFKTMSLNILLLISFFLYGSIVKAEVTAAKNVKFAVDVSLLVNEGKFNPATDTVYLKGWFNSWKSTNPMKAEGNNIYSVTIQLTENSFTIYKYCISTPGAENNGMEKDYPLPWDGARSLNVGVSDLVLAISFFNEANMKPAKTTAHFVFWFTSQDDAVIDDFAQKLENNYNRITSAIEVAIPEKINIRLYKNLLALHTATGWPEASDMSIGTAYGKTTVAMISPTAVDFNMAFDILVHEFAHIANAWKTKVTLTNWLNEGVATYYSYMKAGKKDIKNLISGPGGKPSLVSIENNLNDPYAFGYTIAYFIDKKMSPHSMANFIENMDYTALGYSDKIAFQTAWHQFLDVYADETTKQSVKFSIDMSSFILASKFNPLTDKIYVRGSFNSWGAGNQLFKETGNIYSVTIPLVQYFFYEYKFYIDTPGAANSGWEGNMNETTMGNRLLDLEDKPLILPVARYNVLTGNKPMEMSNIKVFTRDHSVMISGFPVNSLIQVFTVNGIRIIETKGNSDQLSLPLPTGIYILKIGNSARKIIIN